MSNKESNVVNLKPKKISTAVNKAVSSGFQVDTSGDEELFKDNNCSWDDLNKLKEEVGNSLMTFVFQVKQLAENPSILSTLGDKLDEFTGTVKVFFNDVTAFSDKIKDLRAKHEHLSGPITDMDSFDNYNRVTMEYHGLCNELTVLLTPTMAQLILLSSEAIDESASKEEKMTVEVKEVENE